MEVGMNGGGEEMDDWMNGGREVTYMRVEGRRMRRRLEWRREKDECRSGGFMLGRTG